MWDGYLKINRGVCLLQESGHACKISFNTVSVIPARVTLTQEENTYATKILCLQIDIPLLTKQEKEKLNRQTYWRKGVI